MKLSPRQREATRLIAAGQFLPTLVREDDGWHARWRGIGVENDWIDEYVRESVVTPMTEDAESQRHATLHDAWLMALKSITGLVIWDDAECAAFARELDEWSDGVDDAELRGKITFCFHPGEEFKLTCRIPRGRRALKTLGAATYVWSPLCGLRRRDADTLSVTLMQSEAEDFLRSGATNLKASGYGVEGDDLAVKIVADAELEAKDHADWHPGMGVPRPPVKLRLRVKVAGEEVSAEEIRFLLEQGSSLVFFRDHWIEVDRNILKEALRALERRNPPVASPIGFALGFGHVGQLELENLVAHGWVRGIVNELRAAGQFKGLEEPIAIAGLTGELRPYQRRAVAWMSFLTDHGFGALLADDMGLGKTIETIAWLLQARASGMKGATLIVAPLTLLANWSHELCRFAPKLRVYVHHGSLRRIGPGFRLAVKDADVVLTSYTLLVREYREISSIEWSALVLDEAQAIKNPDTRAARAARALLPPRRLALTGTPIENSAADLWSIEEFLNPGLLGDREHFDEWFVKPMAMGYENSIGARLRHALEPFVLRRLKGDPEIAAELGEKRLIKEYCTLTEEERRAYEATLADFRLSERRQGDVFALITALKLVVDGEGKFARLVELLEQIFAAEESALIFTQYAKVGAWLQRRLEAHFGGRVPFLHGALSATQREAAIADFNRRGHRAFILSLKAGGFGLNLVKATHVIHFDRWWNPAVEAQATDRAHRIGQSKTVFVHSFIAAGTLEEHVDEILDRKSRVAGTVVGSGESFLSQLRGDELMSAVALTEERRIS